MKVLFVYNPVAGHLQIKNYLWSIINIFSSEKIQLTVYATQKRKEAYRLVKKYGKDYDRIICSGGDGTLHEVINGIMETKSEITLGYIPAGSVNDYAVSLKLPKNMELAARLAIKGKPKSVDVGKFNKTYFIYVAAFGVFTDVAYETTQELKNVIGRLAYVIQGIKSVAMMKSYKMKIILEDSQFEDEYIYGMVSNTLSAGNLYRFFNQDVELDDGLFEVILIKTPKDLIELGSIPPYLLSGKGDNNLVKIFKTNKIKFVIEEPMTWTLDGENGGKPKEVEIEVIDKAVKIVY